MTEYIQPESTFPDIRLAAVDLDGTLMDSMDHVAESAIDEIRRLNEEGCLVVPCTGRYLRAIPRQVLSMGKVRYAITANGGQIWDTHSLTSLYRVKLPEGTVREILEFMKGKEGYIEIFSQGKSYVNEGDVFKAARKERNYNFIHYFQREHIMVPCLQKASSIWDEAEKLNVFYMEDNDRRQLQAMLMSRGDLQITSSIGGNMEVNAKIVNKGRAMKWLCGYLGIAREETLAVGDGDNDIEMLEFAGYGIAMGNSCDELKRRAGYVTADNDSGGAEDILRRIGEIRLF